ncbi:MAG: DUF5916 domain-containing protein [Gemmatimonadaceae bacterium]
MIRLDRMLATTLLLCVLAMFAWPITLDAQTSQPSSARPDAARPSLRVGVAPGAISLDGRLDEPAWATADSIPDLTQIEPTEGAPPTGRTVVRVLVDGGAIIVGVRADDPEPDRITSFSRQRDASLDNEDHIRLVLDTYLDGRSGYVFVVNPNGARYDALVANQGEGQNADWDALWEAATARTSSGWSVEIRIPLRSLLFRRGLTSWGLNVQRRIQRLQETHRWASADRDVKINMTSRAGLLTDLPEFDLGLGLSIRPAVTAGAGIPAPSASWRDEADASLDVTQRLGANSLASLTLNTDFAETDVDTRRTNLTRFPLLFPEKRTFFLEGSDIFDFGLGLGASSGGQGSDLVPFFSRRIGLLGGREVPLDAGLKVSGREGNTGAGALVVRTGQLDTLSTDNAMGVVRLKQNVLGESSIGAIATFGDPLGASDAWSGGADLIYQTTRFRGDKNFLVGVWGLAMNREGLDGRRHAIGGKIDYPNDLWDIALTYKWIGDDFDPSLGFVPRRGVQITNFNVNFQPRPKRPILGLRVRQMFNEFLNTLVTDLNGKWESYRIFTAPINWRLESGDRIEVNYVPTGERLVAPFEIADRVVIPAGSHHWTRWRLEAQLASKRKLSGQFSWWFGDFYTGRLDELTFTAAWKPSALIIVEMNGTRNTARLREGDFTQQVIGTRVRVNVSPDLQFASYLQYDNQSETFGTNTRLRWTFSPVGDLFVVYNHNANELKDVFDRHRGWRFASSQLLVKAQYAFRY